MICRFYGVWGEELMRWREWRRELFDDDDDVSGGGANTAVRMIHERINMNSFANLLVTPSWIIDVPTGLTSGDTIYFIIQASGSDAGASMVNDINGQQGGQAIKIAETTTSGTTILARHF